jgi:DNA polymerase-1
MKIGENYEIGWAARQSTFTLADVEVPTDIPINVTFIERQQDIESARLWLTLAGKEIGVDIETRGLDPYTSELIMLQFGDLKRQFVIDTRKVDVRKLIPLIVNKTTTLVGQNLKFEYKFFKHNYDVDLIKVKDTLLQEICLHNGLKLPNGLGFLAKRYLNYEAEKETRLEFLTIGDKPFNKKQIVYGAYDVILPILINNIQTPLLKERNQGKLLEIEHEYLKVLGDMEYKGLHFDKSKWETLYNQNLLRHCTSVVVLNDFIIANNFSSFISTQLNLFGSEQKVNIQWSSSKQVVAFFKSLNICPKAVSKSTKKLVYTVDAKVLKTSLNTVNKDANPLYREFILDYLKMKELEQRITTFGIKFFKYINPRTNRLHSSYTQIVSTGRSSSSAPNLQNIPSDPAFRACFTSPEGHRIVNADFSGQENIVLVNKSLDVDLLEFYKGGLSDMHSFIASKIYNIPMSDILAATAKKDSGNKLEDSDKLLLKQRGIAKAAGFAINYGGNGFTISTNLGISEEDGENVYNAYFEAFPGLRTYFDEVIESTLKQGYIGVNDVSNRRLNLIDYDRMKSLEKDPKRKAEYYRLRSKISRLALNAPVQGTAADITKTAAVMFRQWLIEEELTDEAWMTNIIHDEINVECTTALADIIAVNLERCMAKAGAIWCKTIPLLAKAAVGDHWAH